MSVRSVLNICIPSMAMWPDVIDASPQWNRTGEPREHRRYVPERGECHAEQDWDNDETPQARWWRCDACGGKFVHLRGLNPNYCPKCGRRVVDA